MKNQDIFPSEFFVERTEKFFGKLKEIFWSENHKNFLEPYAVNVWKNFLAGTEAINKLIVGDELYEKAKEGPTEFTEGGIRIQENRPKSGGREEAQTK